MIYRAPLFIIGAAGSGGKTLVEKLCGQKKQLECSVANIAATVVLEPIFQNNIDDLPLCAFAVMYVYDITSAQSFEFVTRQVEALNGRTQLQPDFAPVRVIVGTHRDQAASRVVTYEQTAALKNNAKALWLETGLPDLNYEILRRHVSIRLVYNVKERKQLPIIPRSALKTCDENSQEKQLLNLPLNYKDQLVQVISDELFEQYTQESARQTLAGQQIGDQANDHIMESHFFREPLVCGPRANFFDNPYIREERQESHCSVAQTATSGVQQKNSDELKLSFNAFMTHLSGSAPAASKTGPSTTDETARKQLLKTPIGEQQITLAPTFKPSGARRFDPTRLLAQCARKEPAFKVAAIRFTGAEKPLRTGSMLEEDSEAHANVDIDQRPQISAQQRPLEPRPQDLALSSAGCVDVKRPEKLKVKLSELITKTTQPVCVYVTILGETIPVNVLETDNAFVVAEQIARQRNLNQTQMIALTKQLQPQILALAQPPQHAKSPPAKRQKPAKPGKSFFISVNNKRGKVMLRDGQSVPEVARGFCELMQLDQERWMRAAIAAIQAELTQLKMHPCADAQLVGYEQ